MAVSFAPSADGPHALARSNDPVRHGALLERLSSTSRTGWRAGMTKWSETRYYVLCNLPRASLLCRGLSHSVPPAPLPLVSTRKGKEAIDASEWAATPGCAGSDSP